MRHPSAAFKEACPWWGLGEFVDSRQFGDFVPAVPQPQHANERGQFSINRCSDHSSLQAMLHILLSQGTPEIHSSPSGEKWLERLESRVGILESHVPVVS
jgi:hypothetical protein